MAILFVSSGAKAQARPGHDNGEAIAKISLTSRYEMSRDLNDSLITYLTRYVGTPANTSTIALAEAFLKTTYFLANASCAIRAQELTCHVLPKETVHSIVINNLPASLLESDLKRKMPLQVGQMVDLSGDKLLPMQDLMKARSLSFLKKNGFYDADATVEIALDNRTGFARVNLNVTDGTFIKVSDVKVEGDMPLSRAKIKRAYGRMCLSFNQFINAISLGTFSCYSKELERQTTEDLEAKIRDLGYVKARIRVTHQWVDQSHVVLKVEVEQGPHVTWSFNFMDNNAIERNALQQFLATLFAGEQIYRLAVFDVDDEKAPDQQIIRREMENRMTFKSAENVDDAELRETKDRIRDYLINRGYTNAEVLYNLEQNSDRIHINFTIFTGKPFYVREIRVVPQSSLHFLDPRQIDSIMKMRSVGERGLISQAEIEIQTANLIAMYKDKGFADVKIKLDLSVVNEGQVEMTYYMELGQRKTVNLLDIKNGDDKLNQDIFFRLKNCDAGNPGCSDSSYVGDFVTQDAQTIVDHYHNNGYLYAGVRVSESDVASGKKSITYTIYDTRDERLPLKKQEIKGIIISGLTNTKPRVVRRLFPEISLDETVDQTALKKGITYLRESGRFSRIDQKIVQGQAGSEDVYLMINTVERPSLSVDVGAAFSTDQMFSLETELDEQNLFSSMIRLESSLNLGLFMGRRSYFNNRVTWPFIFGWPLKLSINAPSIIYENRASDPGGYRKLQAKVAANLEWRAFGRFIPYIRYWLTSTQEVKINGAPEKTAWESIQSVDGLYSTFMSPINEIRGVFKPGFSIMDLDNPYNPKSGVHSNIWVEMGGGPFLGDPFFSNWGTQNRFFVPLGPLTLALQATLMRAFIAPTLTNWNKLKNAASMDKLGGDRNIRGYNYETIGIDSSSQPFDRWAGYLSNVANVELRFPITKEKEYGHFSGALFVDQGLLVPCTSLWSLGDRSFDEIVKDRGFALSVGAAIRYALPVGPISIDYGVSPIHLGQWRVHLLFGYAF